jgi:hypothetical protein
MWRSHFPFRSSIAEPPADNRQTVARYHAEGPSCHLKCHCLRRDMAMRPAALSAPALLALGFFASCAGSSPRDARDKPTNYAQSAELTVPHSDTFARDRDQSCGFASPREAVGGFMQILFTQKVPAMLHDHSINRRFFTGSLRQQVALSIKQAATWKQGWSDYRTHPGIRNEFNQEVFQAWDTPSTFRLASSHISRDRAMVDVIYKWGRGTQYAGDTRLTSVILVREKGRWFIDDLYTH